MFKRLISRLSLLPLALLLVAAPALGIESFESAANGNVTSLSTEYGTIKAEAGHASIVGNKGRTGSKALHVQGGEGKQIELKLSKALPKEAKLEFWTERWTGRDPFLVRVVALNKKGVETELAKIEKQGTGGFNTRVEGMMPAGTTAVRVIADTADGGGVVIDDLALHSGPMQISSVETTNPGAYPLMKRAPISVAVRTEVQAVGMAGDKKLSSVKLTVSPADAVARVSLRRGDAPGYNFKGDPIASAKPSTDGKVEIKANDLVTSGETFYWLDVTPSAKAKVGGKVKLGNIVYTIDGKAYPSKETITQSIGYLVATGGEEVKQLDRKSTRASRCFRIPGLITTKKGTLVGCFDARYNHAGDLCADIDVSVVRSTDGGQTWTTPAVELDGGPGGNNGVGDPCILQDGKGRIWLQGLAAHFGGHPLFNGKKGQGPDITGQWEMTYSDDDGKTWSRNIVNPTATMKKDEWDCILAGPGSGIFTKKGVIVFPAQIWQKDAEITAMSTICYSEDLGKTWKFGTGVPRRTSECQVVELKDGSLMLNCRDENRSGQRAVFVSKDLGATWTPHETNLNGLREPTCQASIIRVNSPKYGSMLLFSNPKHGSRKHMTIRFSKDEGKTWSDGYEYDLRDGAGYSSLCQIDEDTIGVFYESSQGHGPDERNFGISFMRIPLKDIMGAK